MSGFFHEDAIVSAGAVIFLENFLTRLFAKILFNKESFSIVLVGVKN